MIHPHVTILAERQIAARRIAQQAIGRDIADRLDQLARRPLPVIGASIAGQLREHFDPATLPIQQVLAVAEEAGEFTAAYRRWAGLARRHGPWQDVETELADVLLTAYVTADVLGIDLETAARAKARVVFSRPWREPPSPAA